MKYNYYHWAGNVDHSQGIKEIKQQIRMMATHVGCDTKPTEPPTEAPTPAPTEAPPTPPPVQQPPLVPHPSIGVTLGTNNGR